MENGQRHAKSFRYYVRCLHRDIGFLVLGLTIAYALSGVVLVYRETDFLKSEEHVERTVPQRLASADLARLLHARHFEVTGDEGDVLHFQDGTSLKDGVYVKSTGSLGYVGKSYPGIIEKLIGLHKLGSSKALHAVSVVYGVLLLFLAVSSLFMYRVGTGGFRRALAVSGMGLVLAGGILVAL
jgi:hypothetical protein